MRKRTTAAISAMLILLVSTIFCKTTIAQPQFRTKELPVHTTSRYVPDEIVVKFHPGVCNEMIENINRGHNAAILSSSRFGGFKRLRIPKGKTVEEMVAIYSHNPNVEYAEPNFIAHAFNVPNDPLYDFQWHMDNDSIDYGGIHLNAARDIETGSQDVIVAVIDTGVAYEDYDEPGVPIGKSGKYTTGNVFAQAPDLIDTVFVPGKDFVNNDEHPNDDEGHGTHVTGTIAQSTDNSIGTAGIAPGCAIMPVKVLDNTGSGTYTAISNGIYFATDFGAKVINMSLGGPDPSNTLEAALAYAHDAGVTIVCASGNDSASSVSYPAAYDNYCIAVGATRYDETISYYSNTGTSLDITAPGGDLSVDQDGDGYNDGVLQQTHDGSDYTYFSYWFYHGTSMAAPHVAGVAALLISQGVRNGRDLTPGEVRAALQSSSEDKGAAGWDSIYGWGIVDAAAALQYYEYSNQAPTADPGGTYYGTEDEPVTTFDGNGSYDPDGDTLTCIWDFGDNTSGSGATPTHIYTVGGTYTVTLVVNDGKENSSPATTTAVIKDINDAPVADAGPDRNVLVGESVIFDGSGSYDEEGTPLSYEWNFNDNSTGSGVTTTHTFVSGGTYTVTLMVSDGDKTDTDTAEITVSSVPPPSQIFYVGSIDMAFKKAGINTSALATMTVIAGDGSPVQGATVTGQWSGATSDTDTSITDGEGQVTLVSNSLKRATEGTYTFTVTDVYLEGWEYDFGSSVTKGSISITTP